MKFSQVIIISYRNGNKFNIISCILKTPVDALSNEYGFVKSRFAYQLLPETCNLVDFPNETQKKKKSRVIPIVD